MPGVRARPGGDERDLLQQRPAVTLPPGQAVSAWQGIRDSSTPGQYLMVGTVNGKTAVGQSLGTGILFEGTIDGKTGTGYAVNDPGAQYTHQRLRPRRPGREPGGAGRE